MCAVAAGKSPLRIMSIAPRAIRLTWNGRRHGWWSGQRRSALIPLGYWSGSWPTTAPGDGISRLPGDHSAGRQVLSSTHGSRGGVGAADGRVPLPQHRIDSEELAGPAAP